MDTIGASSGSNVGYLVVGGGGGGGGSTGGGGGAGGLLTGTLAVTAQAYPVTVGAGGQGGTLSGVGTNGGNSVFSSLTAVGGGRGGNNQPGPQSNADGTSGGSGGGASFVGSPGNKGSGTSGQGYDGGANLPNAWPSGSIYSPGGGGGAGSVGTNGVTGGTTGSAGGIGVQSSISGSNQWYAAGGGGGVYVTSGAGTGGSGGSSIGGNGGAGPSSQVNATNGAANTGSGGGGQGGNVATQAGLGGSGVVIISYHTNGSDGVSTSSTGGTITTSGGYTIHTFTSSGTFTAVTTGGGSYNLSAGNVSIGASGTLTANSSTITLTGTSGTLFTLSGGTFNAGTSTVNLSGNGSATVASGSPSFYNFTSSGTGTKSLGEALAVSNNLTISAGTLDAGGGNYGITIGGSWTNSGTFTAENGTVTFNTGSTAIISDTTTFYNLTITNTGAKEVDFSTTGSPVFTVSNNFSVTGHASNLIKLYSGSSPTKWRFLPSATATVDYADVKDGGCESGAITISPTHSTNSGNNDACWSFYVPTITFGMSGNSADLGLLTSANSRYATAGAGSGGSTSEVEAHNFTVTDNSPNGYSVSVIGASLTDPTSGHVITAIGGTNTAPNPGNEQFGLRMVASGGSGTVTTPYDGSGFAYAANGSTASQVCSAATGDSITTTYSVRYISNIAPTTASGVYHANLTYLVTGNF